VTSTLAKKIDALDNWCLRRVLRIYGESRTNPLDGFCLYNDVVRSRIRISHSRQILSVDVGHLCHADTRQDHSRALQACIRGPPKDWRRRTGRPRQTWLRTVKGEGKGTV